METSSLKLIKRVLRGDIAAEDAAHQIAVNTEAHAVQHAQQQRATRQDGAPSDNLIDMLKQPTGVPEVGQGWLPWVTSSMHCC